MISFLMIGSLAMGLVAFILPSINLSLYKRESYKNWAIPSIISISACGISIYCQVIYNNYLVQAGDWVALIDTSGTSTLLSAILLIVTIILNVITIIVYNAKSTS